METLTQCQICLEDMTDRNPMALQCLHTFCHDCLVPLTTDSYICSKCKWKGTLNRADISCPRCREWATLTRKVKLSCPTCRKTTVLPSGDDVDGLPHNFLIDHIKEALHCDQQDQLHVCEKCKTDTAKFICETCRPTYYLCDSCQNKHCSLVPFKEHALRALDRSSFCSIHDLEANYLCRKCLSRICTTCVMSEDHVDHSDAIVDFCDWLAKQQNKIKDIKLVIKPLYIELKAKLGQLEYYHKNTCDVLADIDRTADGMKESIDKQAEGMKARVAQIKGKQAVLMGEMQRYCDEYETFSDSYETIANATDISAVGKQAVLMGEMQRYCDEYETFSDSCETIANATDISAVVDTEAKGIQLQKSGKDLPVIRKETWYKFTPGPMPCLGELEDDEREIKTESGGI